MVASDEPQLYVWTPFVGAAGSIAAQVASERTPRMPPAAIAARCASQVVRGAVNTHWAFMPAKSFGSEVAAPAGAARARIRPNVEMSAAKEIRIGPLSARQERIRRLHTHE